MIVAVYNTKGGVGKTTTVMFLASQSEGALVVDADPQASALDWAEDIPEETMDFDLLHSNGADLGRDLQANEGLYEDIFIDLPPGNSEAVDPALEAADIVLIPTGATAGDMRRVWPTVDKVSSMDTQSVVLITKSRNGTRGLKNAIDALEDTGVPVFDTEIPLREAVAASWGSVPKKTFGYNKIYRDVKEFTDGD